MPYGGTNSVTPAIDLVIAALAPQAAISASSAEIEWLVRWGD